MKKIVLFSFLTLAACALTLSGCREKGLQNVRGMVRSVNIHEDTLISMTVNVNESGDTLVFYLDDARFQQGIMIPQDSVIVDYIDRRDSLKALVVTVLPKAIPVSKPETSDTLVTAPANK